MFALSSFCSCICLRNCVLSAKSGLWEACNSRFCTGTSPPLVTRVVCWCFLVAAGPSTTMTSVGSGFCRRPRRALGWSLSGVAATMWLRSAAQPYRGRAAQLRFVARSYSVDTRSHLYHWSPNEGARRVPLLKHELRYDNRGQEPGAPTVLSLSHQMGHPLVCHVTRTWEAERSLEDSRKLVAWVGRIIDGSLSIWMGDTTGHCGLVRHETGKLDCNPIGVSETKRV